MANSQLFWAEEAASVKDPSLGIYLYWYAVIPAPLFAGTADVTNIDDPLFSKFGCRVGADGVLGAPGTTRLAAEYPLLPSELVASALK
jgi:hypothetical protein